MGAKELLQAFGLSEVELPQPDGWAARIRLPTPQELMRQGEMDPSMRRALLKMREAPDTDEPTDEQVDLGVDFTFVRAARMIRAIRQGRDGEWEPMRFTIAEFLDMPTEAQDALVSIATGERTPAMVSALVRRHRGEITSEEAAALIDADSATRAEAWDTFRREPAGDRPGADSGRVAEGAERLPGDDRPRAEEDAAGPPHGGYGTGETAGAVQAAT
jgi:hypothetical protein